MAASYTLWPALRWRNYRLYLAGQSLSLVGIFMQSVAINWLIYRLTRSELSLGVYAFLAELPGLLVVLFAGVLADRVDCRRILLTTRSLAMLQALALAALVMAGRIDFAAICVLGCFLGLVNGFDVPARHVLMPRMVEASGDLQNAVALYSLTYDSARLIGPALAGLVIAAGGEGPCFLFNGLGCALVLCALLALRLRPMAQASAHVDVAFSLGEGIRHALGQRTIRNVILLIVCVSFAASPVAVLMPVMAGSVLGGGPPTLGFLTAAGGVGALAGAFFLGKWRSRGGLQRTMGGGALLYALAIVSFSLSPWLALSLPLLALAGFGVMVMMACGNTLLLSEAEEAKRGRIMSLYTLSFMGSAPIGGLCAGFLASKLGAPATIGLGGGLCLAGALLFLLSFPARMQRRQ